MQRNNQLGDKIARHLGELGLETPMREYHKAPGANEKVAALACCVTDMMKILGLNLEDDSLKNTPNRVAKMFCWEVFYGLDYDNFPACSTFENKMKVDEMVSVSCSIKSFCEHHLVPFIGIAHIAYIPKTKILGLSIFNRVADFFSRRPQVQERLTSQIFEALSLILDTADVAIVIEAKHFCVELRGVQDSNSETTTSKMGGKFMTVPELRAEFLALTRK